MGEKKEQKGKEQHEDMLKRDQFQEENSEARFPWYIHDIINMIIFEGFRKVITSRGKTVKVKEKTVKRWEKLRQGSGKLDKLIEFEKNWETFR